MSYYKEITGKVHHAFEYAASAGIHDPEVRKGFVAGRAGAIPFGRSSHFAELVAVPEDRDDVVIKVTSKPDDGFILYALLCYHGMIKADWALRVFSAKCVGRRWVFITERLQEHYDHGGTLRNEVRAAIQPFVKHTVILDMHSGNVMLRKDGSVCVLDPLAYSSFELDESRNFMPVMWHDRKHPSHGLQVKPVKAWPFDGMGSRVKVNLKGMFDMEARLMGRHVARAARPTTPRRHAPENIHFDLGVDHTKVNHPVRKHLDNPVFRKGVAWNRLNA